MPSSAEHVCFAHDPARQDALRASRRAGGKARATAARASKHLPAHLCDLQNVLIELVDEVRAGTTPARSAEVIGGLVAKLIDLSKYADERGEQRELLERLEALEQRLAEEQPPARRYWP